MGDDISIIIPTPEPTEEETTVEEIGEELLSRLDELDNKIGELYARIAEFEARIVELAAREYAEIGHSHDGFAPSDHQHDGYATIEHIHETQTHQQREPDRPPEKQHPYFRKLSDF